MRFICFTVPFISLKFQEEGAGTEDRDNNEGSTYDGNTEVICMFMRTYS